MHLLWHWFCSFFKLDLCSLQRYCTWGSGMISIYYGQELRFQVSSSRRWLMQQWGFCLFCALKSQCRASTQQGAPSLCKHIHMYMHITIQYIHVAACTTISISTYVSICVCVCVRAFIQIACVYDTSNIFGFCLTFLQLTHSNPILFGVNHRLLCSAR